ncbi:MAG TPA: 2-oxoglutarate and iron-dependent oxygenase domain-containing protein [Vicinamibacterales bacterium]|nr:2-oxoglutarate and iron-dependent oxygenase domain-containing protein [Vicinamibacterales bacterium]
MNPSEFSHVPVIDVAPLVQHAPERTRVADQIGAACRESGFFYVVNHGVDESLCQRLERLSREFFAQSESQKMQIAMSRGGRAWRGYFPVGRELTSGKPDRKEGLYFGAELPLDHPAVRARTALHGPNLFPEIPGFRETVLRYIDSLTALGHALMSGISLGLRLDEHYFQERYYRDPLVLFRIFNYPHSSAARDHEAAWGVGEHTDYGLLTILRQDDTGGLQVKSRSRWIDAPPIAGSFLCNIGDMLERLTRGIYRSTPHRVINTSSRDRLSFPFFFDPSFDARMLPVEGLSMEALADDSVERWDHATVHRFSGTYGEYLLAQVSKVFPELRNEVL